MSAVALALVLVAAVVHAAWNLVAKRAGGDLRYVLLLQLGAVFLWAPVGAWFAWHEVPGYGVRIEEGEQVGVTVAVSIGRRRLTAGLGSLQHAVGATARRPFAQS